MSSINAGEPESSASSVRRPTEDEGCYLIPRVHVPPGLAQRLRSSEPPAPARPAATVVLVRDGSRAPEVLLLRRPERSGFAAGAWVFPGGAVDPTDASTGAPDPAERTRWADRLGISDPDAAWGYVVAALREAWEETGILLGPTEADAPSLHAARTDLLAGKVSFSEALRIVRHRLDAGPLVYLAHWITPEGESRRYDTRFFLAPVGAGTAEVLHGGELVEALWLTPGAALDAYGADELKMLPPTVHTLRRLRDFATMKEMAGALRGAPVPSHLPRMRLHPDGVMITLEVLDEPENREPNHPPL